MLVYVYTLTQPSIYDHRIYTTVNPLDLKYVLVRVNLASSIDLYECTYDTSSTREYRYVLITYKLYEYIS